jgi:hypothetical protein
MRDERKTRIIRNLGGLACFNKYYPSTVHCFTEVFTMRYLTLLTLLGLPFFVSSIATAQTNNSLTNNPTLDAKFREIEGLSRAKNLARQAAEAANGGLESYRSDYSMHGAAARSPYREQGDAWVFTFKGGAPGETPTIESEVQVNKADFTTTLVYNGAIR